MFFISGDSTREFGHLRQKCRTKKSLYVQVGFPATKRKNSQQNQGDKQATSVGVVQL